MTTGTNALSHLTPEQVAELMSRYYAGERIEGLLQEFSIACRVSNLVKIFPAEVLDLPCPRCKLPMLRRRASRSSTLPQTPYCIECGHQHSPRCRCTGCRALAHENDRVRRNRREEIIAAYCASVNRPPASMASLDDVSPVLMTLLLALVRTADADFHGRFSAVAGANPPFAPTDNISIAFLRLLHSAGLIWLDPSSSPEVFEVEQERVVDVRWLRASWSIPSSETDDLLTRLEYRAIDDSLPSSWLHEVRRLHVIIAAAECRNYFDRRLEERGLPPVRTGKVDTMIYSLLINHSVSQAFGIIWRGAQEAADFLLRKRVPLPHASNFAIGACQRYAEKANAEGWKLKDYRRPFDEPRSMVSHVLHDLILKVGDRAFYLPESLLWPTPLSPTSEAQPDN